MSVILTPKQEQLVRDKVASGDYADESDVLAEAFDLLEQRDKERRAALIAAIEEGEEDIRAGRVTVIRTPEELDEFFKVL